MKPYALVSPHFAVLSSLLVSSPLVLNTALDVLHQSRESLLRVTREHILPDIIFRRDDNLLHEVVKASRAESVAEMLCDPPVAAAVLAHLFVQSETARGPALKYFTASCHGVVLRNLIESVHVPLVYHLALALGDEHPAVAAQVRAFRNFRLVSRIADVGCLDRLAMRLLWSNGTVSGTAQMSRSTSPRP